VNDNPPEWQGLDTSGGYPASVSDRTFVGEHVVTVMATDIDGTSPNNLVTYSFADSNVCPDCAFFSLNTESGDITSAYDDFDREKQFQYVITVFAEDGSESSIIPGGPNRGME
jgi:hypothetical protein